ncbi:MAG TPA: zinc-binding dehydrogenase, partial [Actinomycetota bacterium]|nr:zinc-binding dehydrogenase [Actinomycetota bacterium]
AVWGLGPIGQMCVRIARRRGAGRVIGVDRLPERLELAARHGAEVIDLEHVPDGPAAVEDLTEGRGADSVIDAVGMEADGATIDHVLQTLKVQPDRLHALHQSMSAVRRGGTLSVVGVYVGWMHAFPLGALFDRQITVRMGQANVRRWVDDLLPLLGDEDPLGTADLTTHRVPLDAAPEAYEMLQRKRDGAIKVVLEP